ncbi:MAG: autotransporter-associated beta strand repeat-containing protein, partial [Planctomycetaceae bacterium]|nr:autotransporter-associated beta strand repeat-containing protein [Planctomycetaceae bacterium]
MSGQFTQLANSTLNVAIGASNTPIISAANAQISGTLNVTGFSATYPARASDLSANQHTIISATGFITGNFTNVSLGVGASPVNYLIASGYFNATRNRYYVGTQLRWNVGDNRASGTFDLPDAADQFELDVTLNIQTANPTLNWDGRSLTKEGAGTLLVSTVQGYTGNTIVNGGTLSLSAADALAINAGVTINSGATLALSGGRDQRLNQLSGSGTLNLGSSVATLNNTTAATAFSGSISGTGRVVKQGSQDLTLAGSSTYSGGTTIREGRLVSTTATALGTGAVSLGTGSILQLDHISNTIVNNSVNGTG